MQKDWWGTSPSTWNLGSKWPRWRKITDFQSIFARSASAVTPSEKSSIITNRKSTTRFPMCPRWTSYVVPKTPKRIVCKLALMVVVWHSGSASASINEVNLRRPWLVLRWVSTVFGFNCRLRRLGLAFISVCNSHSGQHSLAIPSWVVRVGAMNTSQMAMRSCDWGVKAGMAGMWVAGKTVWSPCYTSAIYEPFEKHVALYEFLFFALLLTFICVCMAWRLLI